MVFGYITGELSMIKRGFKQGRNEEDFDFYKIAVARLTEKLLTNDLPISEVRRLFGIRYSLKKNKADLLLSSLLQRYNYLILTKKGQRLLLTLDFTKFYDNQAQLRAEKSIKNEV